MAAKIEESLISTKSWGSNSQNFERKEDTHHESSPLIPTTASRHINPKSCYTRRYRIRFAPNKGALIVLICTFAVHAFMPYAVSTMLMKKVWGIATPSTVYVSVYKSFSLLYPIFGWIADAKFGRYKVLTYSMSSILLSAAIMIVAFPLHTFVGHNKPVAIISSIFVAVAVVLNIAGYAGYDANIIPFLTDQVVGASGEELSALIHFHFWLSALAELVNIIVSDFMLNNEKLITVLLLIHFVLSTIALHKFIILKKWLDTAPKITNPIKLITGVLNYARKNKYPRNRSALTYWEDDYPSRIDIGKNKYGGPFSEEEVEDVKTGIRLLPLIFLTVGFGMYITPSSYHTHLLQPHSNVAKVLETVFISKGLQHALCTLLFVPLFHLLIHPCFYNHIPTLLKRVGFGLFLCTCALLYFTILDPVGQHVTNTNICIFINNTTIPLDYRLSIPPTFLGGVGEMFTVLFAVEFIIAQSPESMKGLAVGLWFAFYGILQLICLNLFYVFIDIPESAEPNCGFYYFLSKFLLSVVVFITYLMLSWKYKMRVRDCPVNINILAEDYYNKYLSYTEDTTTQETVSRSDTYYHSESSSCSSCESDK